MGELLPQPTRDIPNTPSQVLDPTFKTEGIGELFRHDPEGFDQAKRKVQSIVSSFAFIGHELCLSYPRYLQTVQRAL